MLRFSFLPHPTSRYCLPPPSSSLPVVKSEQLCPATKRPKKKKKADLVNSAAECQGARRVGGGSVTPRAHSQGARRPPLPSVPPSPASPGSERRPRPGEIRGCSRLPSPPPLPPPGTSARASKPPLIWTSFLLPLNPRLFITALERGSRAPGLASPISQKREGGYLGTQESRSPRRCHLQATPHRKPNFY